MRILMVGDVFGKKGRELFKELTPRLKAERKIDFVVVNGENSAGGKGIVRRIFDELCQAGADVVTSGNHIWDNKEVMNFIDDEPYLVRPANYPPGTPGRGWCVYQLKSKRIAVVNMSGRAFMPPVDCPFQRIEDILYELKGRADIILVDFHAETTSEKMALGWYLDGRVTAVVGTHTHVQTADERILHKGTAFISDLGMTGPWDSVIGDDVECIIRRFTTGMPVRFVAEETGPGVYSGVIIDVNDKTNEAVAIERILVKQ